jgi:hypothetical protein
MKLLFGFLLWCILLVLCWPLAALALILFPIIWLISIPLRIVVIVISAILRLLKAILFLPARVLQPRKALEARAC